MMNYCYLIDGETGRASEKKKLYLEDQKAYIRKFTNK